MAKLKAKVWVTREGRQHCPVVTFEESGNSTPYGSGQYIAVIMPSGADYSADYRYMIHYDFKTAVKDWIENYFGIVDKIEFIE